MDRLSGASPARPRRGQGDGRWVFGGFLGAFYVIVVIIMTSHLGAHSSIGFILAGQVISSVILGWFGLLNLPIRLIALPRLAGAALAVAVMVPRS